MDAFKARYPARVWPSGLEHSTHLHFVRAHAAPGRTIGPLSRAKAGSRWIENSNGRAEWTLSSEGWETQAVEPIPLEVNGADERLILAPKGYYLPSSDARWVSPPTPGRLWLYNGSVFHTNDADLSASDVRALANVQANRRRLEIEKAHALQAMIDQASQPRRREAIPQATKLEVWQRDAGRCVECLSQEKLEFDHIIPLAMGGSNTSRNLQLLCETCNRRKGASLG